MAHAHHSRNRFAPAAIFTAHPATVGESYFGHMRFALWFAGQLFAAGGAALLHALIPALCETTASDRVRALAARLENRHRGG